MATNGRPRRKGPASSAPCQRPDHPSHRRGWIIGATRIKDFSPPATPNAPRFPPLNAPEFDEVAKNWLEELIRRAQASERPASAKNSTKPTPLTIPARGEGAYAFDFYVTNMYDLRIDPLGLMSRLKEVSRDALEAAVRDAGFSGLIAPGAPGMKGPISVVFDFEESVRIAAPGSVDECLQ